MRIRNRVLQSVKFIIRHTPFSPVAEQAYHIYLRAVGKRHRIQDTKISTEYPLIRLGSEYGGWTFVDDENLNNSIILSAGLGTDASFDVEFANKYNSKVIIIDPTPSAIHHFDNIMESIGKRKRKEYSEGGNQSIENYELSDIDKSQLVLIKKALWDKNTKVKFYKPKKRTNVSHSITNWQHNYSNDTDFIEVPADTIFSILQSQNIDKRDIDLIKLDIEGAEIEVITNMMEKSFFPKQILVEFDELHDPSKKAVKRVDQVHELLLENGYELLYTDGIADFLYYKNNDTI